MLRTNKCVLEDLIVNFSFRLNLIFDGSIIRLYHKTASLKKTNKCFSAMRARKFTMGLIKVYVPNTMVTNPETLEDAIP